MIGKVERDWSSRSNARRCHLGRAGARERAGACAAGRDRGYLRWTVAAATGAEAVDAAAVIKGGHLAVMMPTMTTKTTPPATRV